MKRSLLFAVLGFPLVLAGCQSAPTVVGKWKVDPEFAKKDPAGAQKGFMTGFASTFKYEFKPDKTFEGSASSGTYTLEGTKLSMDTTKLMGQDISQFTKTKPPAMLGELSADGKTLTLHLPSNPLIPAGLKDIPLVKAD